MKASKLEYSVKGVGGLQMSKPDFKAMSQAELRQYVLSHRDDTAAMRELFVNRSDPNGKIYPPSCYESGMRTTEEALRLKLGQMPSLEE